MKRLAYILLLLSLSLSTQMSAQLKQKSSVFLPRKGWDLVEVGARGGMSHNTLVGPLKAQPGMSVGLDLVYRGQFLVRNMDQRESYTPAPERFYFGPLIGLGATYSTSSFTLADSTSIMPLVSPNGYKVVDTVRWAGRENYNKLQLEVPFMLAMSLYQVTFNVGVVGVCELIHWQEAVMDNPVVNMYIPVAKLSVDMPVTPMEKGPKTDIKFHLYLAGQVGYEWQVAERHRIGLQACLRFDCFRMNSGSNEGIGQWQEGQLTMAPYTQSYKANIHYLDFGVRVYYAFAYEHKVSRLGLLAL